jgi:hypothetical protein
MLFMDGVHIRIRANRCKHKNRGKSRFGGRKVPVVAFLDVSILPFAPPPGKICPPISSRVQDSETVACGNGRILQVLRTAALLRRPRIQAGAADLSCWDGAWLAVVRPPFRKPKIWTGQRAILLYNLTN